MKKLLLSLSLLVLACSSFAQSDAYKNGMKSLITKLGTTQNSPDAYQDAANGFMRIANAEKTEWLPKYYMAYASIMQAMFIKDKTKVDAILDEADKTLSELSEKMKSDEVMCLQSLSKSTRIQVDPMTRGMKFGMESAKFLAAAKALNPENPRIYFLMGESALYTPEAYGGGKKAAKELFKTSVDKYATFKPSNDLMPNWGKESAQQMLDECSK